MHGARVLLTLMTLTLAGLAPAAAGWGNDAQSEPSTAYDQPRYIWQAPNDRTQLVGGVPQDRVYFNGQLNSLVVQNANVDLTLARMEQQNGRASPVTFVRLSALLGYWRDCNNDGYIGDRTTGLRAYPASASPVDTRLCPVGSAYNPGALPGTTFEQGVPGLGGTSLDQWRALGPVVHELLPIGIDNGNKSVQVPWSVNDSVARVWADITPPDRRAVLTKSITPLPHGTFDSWNGHIAYADDLTFRQASGAYSVACNASGCTRLGAPGSVYETPLEGNSPKTPLYSVYALYGQESTKYGRPEGRPAVRVWECQDEKADPRLNPRADASVNTRDMSWSGGSVGDSVNNTVKGLVVRGPDLGVSHPNAPWYEKGVLRVGQGCDGAGGPAVLPNGFSPMNFVGRLQYEDEQNAPVKDRTDFFFRYFPPRAGVDVNSGNQPVVRRVAPSGLLPHALGPAASYAVNTFNDGEWIGGIQLLRPTTNPDEFGYGVTKANWWVFYAKVDLAKHQATAFPGATFDPVQRRYLPPSFVYGQEACTSPHTGYNGWDCSAWPNPSEAWLKVARDTTGGQNAWRVTVGETYQLRDTDCTDLTPAAPGTVTPLRQRADAEYNRVARDRLGSDLHLFSTFCS